MRSRVELFEQIRRDRRLGQLSIRELAERHGVHRRSVRQALESAAGKGADAGRLGANRGHAVSNGATNGHSGPERGRKATVR